MTLDEEIIKTQKKIEYFEHPMQYYGKTSGRIKGVLGIGLGAIFASAIDDISFPMKIPYCILTGGIIAESTCALITGEPYYVLFKAAKKYYQNKLKRLKHKQHKSI